MYMSSIALFYCIGLYIGHSQKYIVQQQSLTKDAAEHLCLFNYEQHLASIHSELVDWTDAQATLGTLDAFIGLSDIANEGTWLWTDATIFDFGNPAGASKPPWRNGQPDNFNNNQDCVSMNHYNDGLWDDIECTAKRYSLCNYPQTTPLFNDPSTYIRIPSANNAIGTIDILDNIHIEFDIIFTSWPSNPTRYGSILHIGDGIINAQRLPGIYVYGGMTFHQSTTFLPHWDTFVSSNGTRLNLAQKYHFSYIQTQNTLQIYVDGTQQLYDGTVTSHAIIKDRTVYLGNAFNVQTGQLFDAEVSNLYIATSNAHSPNGFNYNCDGSNRLEIISGSWTINDNACIIRATDDTATTSVVWMGNYDTTSLNWDNFKIEVKFSISSGSHAGVLFRAQSISPNNDHGQQYYVGISKGCCFINEVFMVQFNNGDTSILLGVNVGISYNTEYTLRVEANGNTFDIYWNNEFLFNYTDTISPIYNTGSVGLRTYFASATYNSVRIMFPTDNYLYTIPPSLTPTTSNPTTSAPTTPTTVMPTTSIPTSSEPTTQKPTTTEPTTNVPTTIEPTTNIPTTSEPTTYVPTTHAPVTMSPSTTQPTRIPIIVPTNTKNDKEIDVITTITIYDGDGSNSTSANKDEIILIIAIIAILMVIILIVGILLCCCKQRRRHNKCKLETNVEIGKIIHNETTVADDDTEFMQQSDEDILAAVNQTDMGNKDESDEDVVALVNQTKMGDIPPNVNKINFTTANGNNMLNGDDFIVDGDSEDEVMIGIGLNNTKGALELTTNE